MFRLVLPCCEIESKNVSIDEDKAVVSFHWITKDNFIKPVLWWTYGFTDIDSVGSWHAKLLYDNYEKEFIVPSMNYVESCTMTGQWLVYGSVLNSACLASDDGSFEMRFNRMKRVCTGMPYTPTAGHDVEYTARVLIPVSEVPDVAREIAAATARRKDLKRKADELRAMAEKLEQEAKRLKHI